MAADEVARTERETVALLQDLIRTDTSNPPGNETAAVVLLDSYFRSHGLAGEIVGADPARQNFVFKLQGTRPGPTLLLLSHTDVVPADPEGWTVPPFSGELRDGAVWGRGAIDMKNLVAAYAVAVCRLAAAGADFAGTVIYAATANEEVGPYCGVRWLLAERPDLIRCDYLLTEGGGGFSIRNGVRVHELVTGEKGTTQFRLTVHGEAGHGAMPMRRGNAIVAAAEVIRALHGHRAAVDMGGVSAQYVESLVADTALRARLLDPGTARDALDELYRRDPDSVRLLDPLYGVTMVPTMLHADSTAVNMYSQRVQIGVDCRAPAGWGEAEVLAEVQAALASVDAQWELEWAGTITGNCSRFPSPLGDAIASVMTRLVPGATAAPLHCSGFCDANWVRTALPDVVAYGFAPHVAEDNDALTARYHGIDERIAVDDLVLQEVFAEQIVAELLR